MEGRQAAWLFAPSLREPLPVKGPPRKEMSMNNIQQQVQEAVNGLVESGAERGLQVAVYRHGEQVIDAIAGTADPATERQAQYLRAESSRQDAGPIRRLDLEQDAPCWEVTAFAEATSPFRVCRGEVEGAIEIELVVQQGDQAAQPIRG